MSSQNVMEVISKGSFKPVQPEGSSSAGGRPLSSRSTSTQTAHSDSQLTLEFLPPEAPHYATNTQHTELRPTEGGVQLVTTAELYKRVHQLSEKIKTEFGHLEDIESLSSSCWPTPPLPEAGERGLEVISDFKGQSSTNSTLVESLDESASEDDDVNPPDANESIRPSDEKTVACNSLSPDGSNDEIPRKPGGNHNHSGDTSNDFSNKYSQTDPRLQRAFQKMNKLDAKLADLSRKEKEVKRQRQLLEQGMGGAGKTSMALVVTEESEGFVSPSPVFATQLDDDSSTTHEDCIQKGALPGACVEKASEEEGHRMDSHRTKVGSQPQGGTDFIRRNIELASDAGALVAMTEAEKKRVQELLEDDTAFEDPYVAPLGLQPAGGGGFTYSKQEEEIIRDIDSQLQVLMPLEHWESICSSSCNSTPVMPPTAEFEPSERSVPPPELGKIDTSKHIDASQHIVPGEEVLQQFQMSREESQRLKDIEEKLAAIQNEKNKEAEIQLSLPASDLAALLLQYRDETPPDTANQTDSGTDFTTV